MVKHDRRCRQPTAHYLKEVDSFLARYGHMTATKPSELQVIQQCWLDLRGAAIAGAIIINKRYEEFTADHG